MKNLACLLALLLASCSSVDRGDYPHAEVKVRAVEDGVVGPYTDCVIAGTTVLFDASNSSDQDGEIVRYVFTIGHNAPPIVVRNPKFEYVFEKPIVDGQQLVAYQILLTVTDDSGNLAYTEVELPVVFHKGECPSGSAPPDVFVPSTDVFEPDVISPDDVPLTESIDPEEDIIEPDWGPLDAGFPELPQDKVTPDVCPNVEGDYRLSVYCQGVLSVEVDLEISQDVCALSDNYGLVSGQIDLDGSIEMSSPQDDFGMAECTGPLSGDGSFSLDCTSGCTAVFMPI